MSRKQIAFASLVAGAVLQQALPAAAPPGDPPLAAATAGAREPAADPIAYGQQRLAEAGLPPARVTTTLDATLGREAFQVRGGGSVTRVVGGDPTGAMYGLLELAERIRAGGARVAVDAKFEGVPYLADRGLNLFLTLPWSDVRHDTDYDPAALTDPARWWFADDDYWTTLLDQMAEARLDWLDLHGMWDISSTGAPNLYAYFVHSEAFPEVGVAPAIKAANLARLNQVIERAHARGVRVSLMSYEARLATPHRRDPPYPNDEATAFAYTRDAVLRLIRGAPGLDAIGFRIGESGRGGDFFRCYVEAVAASGRDIPLLTRSWVTRKEQVVPLARASSDFTVEIKYDGEQWAAPYPFAGGRVANWHSYSFEDYLSDSRTHDATAGAGAPAAKRLWPGQPDPSGERWPDQPYKIVWQVRANGTHRIFPFHEPDWVRRSIAEMRLGTASGYTIEPLHAYFPATPTWYLADPALRPCRFTHQRDELYLHEWGRLGYDPKTPDTVFAQKLAERFGPVAEPLDAAWRAASRIVPLALLSHAFGPDHRDHAPELEWGGTTRDWIEGEGLDTHAFLPIREEIALRATGGDDGRIGALRVADELDSAADAATRNLERVALVAANVPVDAALRLRELQGAVSQLAALGRYHAGRQRAAWWTALANAAPGTPDARARASQAMDQALAAWTQLAESPAAQTYAPFTDRLRMHTHTFHWRDELRKVRQEADALRALAGPIAAAATSPPRRSEASAGPAVAIAVTLEREVVVASVPAAGIDRAHLLHKPLPSSTFFHRIAMERDGAKFVARIPRLPCGHLLAVEVTIGDVTRRLPDPLLETPWKVVPARAAPTPLWFSTGSALDHLDPQSLDPAQVGPLVVAPRAWQTFRDFEPLIQRKLLTAVERGCTLLLLQQDYTSGRYPLAWLPNPPKVENARLDTFDPGTALDLDVVRAPDIVTQRFVATDGWELHGNGAVAHARLGEGEVWLVQARLIQHLELPSAARALRTLLRSSSAAKPVVLIDAGTENNRFGTSVLPDFMNAHDLAFLTLGEVIAQAQGVAAAVPVPGAPWDDLVLDGEGPARQQRFMDALARAAAKQPAPASRTALEAWQPAQSQAIHAALGLDPLPPRTPLQARVTGVVQRDGYRIEKVVYESRPGFPVTAHLYVPTAAGPGPFPVLLNPHGHWQHKKLEPVVQQRLIQQARHGYLALIVDSPGYSFEGDARIERRFAGPHQDFRVELGSCCAGAVYVWDLMRGLDWLETRPEADMTRVGITGASGGGHATLWTFAADPRIDVAVPVVFATSLEIEPHNGCPCNHIPGTLRLGDRADVLAARAPAPVLVLGATDDGEFPPAGTRRTGEKLKERYALLDAEERVDARVFPGPHDYNLAMVGHALGFFDRWLKGEGDGAPLELTAQPTEPVDAAELFCLAEPPPGTRTLRDLAAAALAAATAQPRTRDPAEWLRFNGGVARPSADTAAGAAARVVARDLQGRAIDFPTAPDQLVALAGRKIAFSFESAPGLSIPALLWIPRKEARGAVVLVGDDGKERAPERCTVEKLLLGGFVCCALDPRGFGELDGIDLRLSIYLNAAPAVAAANDVAAAVALLAPLVPHVAIVGDGAAGSLTALAAGLALPELSAVIGRQGLRDFADAFDESVPLLALQPQADRVPPLPLLRAAVQPPSHFTFRGDAGQDLYALLLRLQRR